MDDPRVCASCGQASVEEVLAYVTTSEDWELANESPGNPVLPPEGDGYFWSLMSTAVVGPWPYYVHGHDSTVEQQYATIIWTWKKT